MLKNVNLLYLGCSVLCLIDISYLSRFWTQFEAWLSMQAADSTGLHPAPKGRQRHTFKCIHNATKGNEDEKLRQMWATRKPAHGSREHGAGRRQAEAPGQGHRGRRHLWCHRDLLHLSARVHEDRRAGGFCVAHVAALHNTPKLARTRPLLLLARTTRAIVAVEAAIDSLFAEKPKGQ